MNSHLLLCLKLVWTTNKEQMLAGLDVYWSAARRILVRLRVFKCLTQNSGGVLGQLVAERGWVESWQAGGEEVSPLRVNALACQSWEKRLMVLTVFRHVWLGGSRFLLFTEKERYTGTGDYRQPQQGQSPPINKKIINYTIRNRRGKNCPDRKTRDLMPVQQLHLRLRAKGYQKRRKI